MFVLTRFFLLFICYILILIFCFECVCLLLVDVFETGKDQNKVATKLNFSDIETISISNNNDNNAVTTDAEEKNLDIEMSGSGATNKDVSENLSFSFVFGDNNNNNSNNRNDGSNMSGLAAFGNFFDPNSLDKSESELEQRSSVKQPKLDMKSSNAGAVSKDQLFQQANQNDAVSQVHNRSMGSIVSSFFPSQSQISVLRSDMSNISNICNAGSIQSVASGDIDEAAFAGIEVSDSSEGELAAPEEFENILGVNYRGRKGRGSRRARGKTTASRGGRGRPRGKSKTSRSRGGRGGRGGRRARVGRGSRGGKGRKSSAEEEKIIEDATEKDVDSGLVKIDGTPVQRKAGATIKGNKRGRGSVIHTSIMKPVAVAVATPSPRKQSNIRLRNVNKNKSKQLSGPKERTERSLPTLT